jgi:hypothetical protein
MTTEERERISSIVQQIQVEKDQNRFSELMDELYAIVCQKDSSLRERQQESAKL